MVQFVTAFVAPKNLKNRTPDQYFNFFRQLASSQIPILLYLDINYKSIGESICSEFKNVIIPEYITVDTTWLPKDLLLPGNRNVTKDTPEYFSIQLSKLFYMKKASEISSDKYISWIDFGIFHMVKNTENFKQKLKTICNTCFTFDNILSPGNKNYVCNDIWNTANWKHMGSFLIANRNIIDDAYNAQMQLVNANLPKLTWEINYWSLMDNFFTIYNSDHNDTIINLDESIYKEKMNDQQIIEFVKPYTSVSIERIQNVLNLIQQIYNENIPGDLVEIGVWKGGIIMAMCLKCSQLGMTRTIHAYDTFEGMTAPSGNDVNLNGVQASTIFEQVKCLSLLEETQSNIETTGYKNVVFHKGDILKTTSDQIPNQIALLRLDTDWYESTRFELLNFEPNVVTYGFIIVDDYGHWQGCRKAVDELVAYTKYKIDYTGVWWRKDYGRSIVQSAVRDHPESEWSRVLLENFDQFVNINRVLRGQFWRGCGSYMFNGQNYIYQRETLKKQEYLFEVGKHSTNVLEIGVYLGHSLLILLLSNPNLKITCIDIESRFSPTVVNYLNSVFGNRIKFILGSAADVLPTLKDTYDSIHIDADHNIPAVKEQFELSSKLARENAYFVFDDYEAVRSYVDSLFSTQKLIHVKTPWCLWTNTVSKLGHM